MISQQEQLLTKKNTELQKKLAAKTRELRIETSLQKIWQTTMAMQHSEEMKEVSLILLQEMQQSGINSAVCFIAIINETDLSMEMNVANKKSQDNVFYKCGVDDHWVNRKIYDNWKTKKPSFVINLEGAELEDYRLFLKKTGFYINTGNRPDNRFYNIDELNGERLKPKAERDEQLENEILNDLKENQQKINHHGKRADAIVKGMLQHSRKSSGQKEPTDINALTNEYLRLSYHGLRAKDKSFNAAMKTDFDERIGKINVIPQDIGRVILNLFNNGFYAVSEKLKAERQKYEPTVSVCTQKVDGHINIHVKDNGNGIPQTILDKIFQPFFTTKPTGQGTGLGLSLSYDIIKAHGGELKVETKENEGSEFVIQLPV